MEITHSYADGTLIIVCSVHSFSLWVHCWDYSPCHTPHFQSQLLLFFILLCAR